MLRPAVSAFPFRMPRNLPKLAIVAGGGRLPFLVKAACKQQARPFCVVALEGYCDPDLVAETEHCWIGMGQAGALFGYLRDVGAGDVVLCGQVRRPNFLKLLPDLTGLLLLPRIALASLRGDDHLLRSVVQVFEQRGFQLVGVDVVVGSLVAGKGVFTARQPTASELEDVRIGFRAARQLGERDIGQAVVVAAGRVVAEEDRAGTDAMLRRLAGHAQGGVLVKCAKPQQERRVDLPAIGIDTVVGIVAAGLAGIAVEAGASLILDQEDVVRAANAAGVFIAGVDANE